MTVEPQTLERSVLEGKERDELAAIAEALGLKPNGRASKATLIGQILKGAGIVDADEKPKRARSSRTAPGNGMSERPLASDTPSAAPEPDRESAGEGGAEAGEREQAEGSPETVEQPGAAEARVHTASVDTASATSEAPAGERRGPSEGTEPSPSPSSEASSEASPEGGGSATDAPQGRSRRESNGPAGPADANGSGGSADGSAAAGVQVRPEERQRDRERGPREQRDSRDQGANGEPGNRRGRRRRGRDRDRDRERTVESADTPFHGDPVEVEGLLDLRDEGYGFLRTGGYLAGPRDVYVSLSQVRRFALRKGDYVKGASRPAGASEKYPALLRIDTVNGMTPDDARGRPRFESLTPLFPDEKLRLEVPGDANNMTSRIVDLISPIGKGQRGLIVSPPKAGKTTVMKQIARSIETNSPEVHLMVLLVDERPEEVTDMRRWVKGEVVASTFDRPSEEHTQVAELAIERAKRLVEMGRDVVIILDGITRLARAYNLAAPATGRIMSGGVDSGALYPPKRFFGAARNMEEGGSLTILATALVETGSKMDEVIFEEFKGTGNMELRLDRKLAERRIYPSIDVEASSTRHEELLFERNQLQQVWKLRRVLSALDDAAGLELLMDKIRTTASNDEFLAEIAKAPTATA